MTDVTLRIVIVAGVAVVAIVIGLVVRSGSLVRRVPVRLTGVPAGLVLFTSRSCASCGRVRSSLVELGLEATEIVAEDAGGAFPLGVVDRVPALASVDERGEGWIVKGVPSTRRIRRWVDGP